MNRYLLDTCVLSEYVRKKPNQSVIQWLDRQSESSLYISVLTLGELKKGIVKIELSAPSKYQQLNTWLEKIVQRFADRILPLDKEMLINWGKICGKCEQKGIKLPIIDSLIAATAISYELILVTRNEIDFRNLELDIYNIWK